MQIKYIYFKPGVGRKKGSDNKGNKEQRKDETEQVGKI